MMANRSDRRLLTLRCVRALEAVGMSTRTRRADFHQGQGSFATPISQAGYMTATRFPLSVPHPCTRAGSIYDTTFLYWLSDFAERCATGERHLQTNRRATGRNSEVVAQSPSPTGEHCKTKERFANAETGTGFASAKRILRRVGPQDSSLARRRSGGQKPCRLRSREGPSRSAQGAEAAAQDDTQWHQAPFRSFAKVSGGRRWRVARRVRIDGIIADIGEHATDPHPSRYASHPLPKERELFGERTIAVSLRRFFGLFFRWLRFDHVGAVEHPQNLHRHHSHPCLPIGDHHYAGSGFLHESDVAEESRCGAILPNHHVIRSAHREHLPRQPDIGSRPST